jgi:hypothetical protein
MELILFYFRSIILGITYFSNHYRVEKIKSATSQGFTNRLSNELFISISERGLITDKYYLLSVLLTNILIIANFIFIITSYL